MAAFSNAGGKRHILNIVGNSEAYITNLRVNIKNPNDYFESLELIVSGNKVDKVYPNAHSLYDLYLNKDKNTPEYWSVPFDILSNNYILHNNSMVVNFACHFSVPGDFEFVYDLYKCADSDDIIPRSITYLQTQYLGSELIMTSHQKCKMGFVHMGLGMAINVRKQINGSPVMNLEDVVHGIQLSIKSNKCEHFEIYIPSKLIKYFSKTYKQNVIPFYNSFIGHSMKHDIDVDSMINFYDINSFIISFNFKADAISFSNGYSSDSDSYLLECYMLNANVFTEKPNKHPVLFSS